MLRTIQRIAAREGLMRRLGFLMGPYNPWLPEYRSDPYPAYRRLREQTPVARMPLFGSWVASRYADVEHVLHSPGFTTDRSDNLMWRLLERGGRGAPDFLAFTRNSLLTIDGERHRRLRGLVGKAFTPRRVAALRPRIEAIAHDLFDRARAAGEVDLVRDVAVPLPLAAIGELLGVPAEDGEKLRAWSDDLVEILDPFSGDEGLEPPKRACTALGAYFRELFEERRREPRDDLVSAMLAAEDAGERLTQDELISLCALILAAGHETTTNLIGNAAVCLLRNPDERKRLQDDLALLPGAVEEFLRFESPVQVSDRLALEPCELAGKRVRKGQLVVVLLGGANRDPERFADPDVLDLGRTENRHLSFGHGNHFCLGAALARLETQVALETLLTRYPDFTGVDGAGAPDKVTWKPSIVLRGPTTLPLRLA